MSEDDRPTIPPLATANLSRDELRLVMAFAGVVAQNNETQKKELQALVDAAVEAQKIVFQKMVDEAFDKQRRSISDNYALVLGECKKLRDNHGATVSLVQTFEARVDALETMRSRDILPLLEQVPALAAKIDALTEKFDAHFRPPEGSGPKAA
jgi:hypothetical protein